jgi:hypothetical protein
LGFTNWPVIYYKPTSFLAPSSPRHQAAPVFDETPIAASVYDETPNTKSLGDKRTDG